MRKSSAVAALALLVASWVSPSPATDLLDTYRIAEKSDPTLRGQVQVSQSVAEGRRQAFGSLLPEIGFDLQRTFSNQRVVSADNLVFEVGEARFPTTNWTLSLSQPVLRFDLFSQLRRAESEERAAQAELARVRQSLMVRVAELYFQVLSSNDNLMFTRTELKAVQGNAKLVAQQYASGVASITDHTEAQARYALVVADEVAARRAVSDAEHALAEVLGRPPGNLAELTNKFEAVSPEPADVTMWTETSLQQNLELSVRRHEVAAAREQIETARTGHYPTVDFVARYNRNDSGGSLFGGGSEVDTYDFSLQVKVPFYQGGRTESAVRQAFADHGKALEDMELSHRAVKRQVADGFEGARTAISRIAALTDLVTAQKLVVQNRAEGFKSGLFTLLAVLDAERDLNSALRDLSSAKYDYILSSLRLKEAAGTLQVEDLASINKWLR